MKRKARATRLATIGLCCTLTSLILVFVMAYFTDKGGHYEEALLAALGCFATFSVAFIAIIMAFEESM